MTQTALSAFKPTEPLTTMKVRSDTHKNLQYEPSTDPPFCQCKDFVHRGGYCKHIQRLIIIKLKKENQYLRERTVKQSTAFWHSFDQLQEHYEWSDNWEINTLCNSFLSILMRDGPSTTDSLHILMGDQFQHDKRIVGNAIRKLRTELLIQGVGWRKSERKICHGSIKQIYELTEKGKGSMGRFE